MSVPYRFGWMLWLPLIAACSWESRPAASDRSKEKPPYALSEPVPLPGNHDRIALTVDPDRPSANRSPAIGAGRAPTPSSPPSNPGGKSSGQDRGSAPDRTASDTQAKTMFDPENLRVKPGHWLAIQNEGESNSEDFVGTLQYSMRRGDFEPRVIPGTRYFLRSRRPASLVKEQPKRFETPLFVVDSVPLTVAPELLTAGGGLVLSAPERLLPLKPHQYHMVLMSEKPDTYSYLSVMPSIRNLRLNALLSEFMDYGESESNIAFQDFSSTMRFNIDSVYYKLTFSKWSGEVELPANMQQWTSIAYLIWCDFAPERLSDEQTTALIDWLHFGGQLIVSSEGIESLYGSELKSLLPVRPTGAKNESLQELLPMMERWGLQRDSNQQPMVPSFAETETFVKTTWELQPAGSEVPDTNGLVVERAVGKGRIVVTAFPLNLTRLRSWTSLDHWFNSCLLRRPGRQHRSESELTTAPYAAGRSREESSTAGEIVGFQWVADQLTPHQPSVFTTVEFAARDWRVPNRIDRPDMPWYQLSVAADDVGYLPKLDATNRRFALGSTRRSQAGWDDYSEVAQAARSSLKEQAGITPPGREWVLQSLLIYLVVLVPLNYAVFRVVRRLELAWFAIPLIAVVGAVMVVRAASLDIGFSNKRLQINVLEIPVGYSRGHLTGYGSLYSSLTTQFRFESENPTTLALPFPAANQPISINEPPEEFRMEVGRPIRFGPQQVLSNTMEMYQFQQMVDLGGGFALQSRGLDPDRTADQGPLLDQVLNSSRFSLADVGIFKSDPQTRETWYGRIAELKSGQTVEVRWQKLQGDQELATAWENTCLRDRQYWAAAVEALFKGQDLDPYAQPWSGAVGFLQPERAELAAALARVAEKRRLAPDVRLTPGLLDAALQDAHDVGLSLGSLFRAAMRYPLGPGEIRLVGWTDDVTDQWAVYPAVSQADQRSLVIAHLAQPEWPKLGFDTNLAYPPRGSQDSDDTFPWDVNESGTSPSQTK